MRFHSILTLPALLLGALLSQSVAAFDKGQRVWIDLPAVNINDDSYGEGQITQDTGDKQVTVLIKSITASKAFSSGVSCAPMDKQAGWENPDFNTITSNQKQTFPRTQLMDWTAGYNRYYERQNWLHSFLKWQDDHPVIERSQLVEAGNTARARNLTDLAAVSDLVIASYDAHQTEHFHFYTVPERIVRLTPLLQTIKKHLDANTALKQAWQPQQRSIELLNASSYVFFMTEAIDKIVRDAQKSRRLLITNQLEATVLQTFDQALAALQR